MDVEGEVEGQRETQNVKSWANVGGATWNSDFPLYFWRIISAVVKMWRVV